MRKEPVLSGAVLIALGLGLYALLNLRIDESVVFLAVGGSFVAAYFYRRQYGFLIPGCILLGMALGELGFGPLRPYIDQPTLFGLGLGFFAIYAVDRWYTRAGSWWPLIPGSALTIIAVAEDVQLLEWFMRRGWPLAIVVIGVALVLSGLLGRGGNR